MDRGGTDWFEGGLSSSWRVNAGAGDSALALSCSCWPVLGVFIYCMYYYCSPLEADFIRVRTREGVCLCTKAHRPYLSDLFVYICLRGVGQACAAHRNLGSSSL
jgi:hypothetical protein